MPLHATIETSFTADRLTLTGTQQLAISGTTRIVIQNSAPSWGGSDDTYDPTFLGFPSTPRVSFAVKDGWQLPSFNRLTLQGSVRATLKGSGQLMLIDFGPRARIVLSGKGA